MSPVLHAVLLGLVLLSSAVPPVAAQSDMEQVQFRYSGVERVVAIADVHGAYDPFVSLLQGTGLVDAQLHWIGGETHLVIVGDILDRGARSREVLDLVMQLEQQAPTAGGAVHMVLGNHEIMNMTGELAWVSREEFESYRDLESAAIRRRAQGRFAEQARGLSTLALRTAFTRQYPRGYFGHRSAFAPAGSYGSWLLQQPVVLVINDTAFVHAGLSAALLDDDISSVNRKAGSALANYLAGMQLLIDADVLHPETDFLEHPALLARYLRSAQAQGTPAGVAAQALLTLRQGEPFGPASTVWYRGMIDCSAAIEHDRVQQALAQLNVSRLVIGHTPTPTHMVQQRFDNALVMADTGMLADYYGGQPAAVIIEGDSVAVFYASGGAATELQPQARMVGPRAAGMDDAGLEALLHTATISASSATNTTAAGEERSALQLQHANHTVAAVFSPGPAPDFIPEVAAYRLDRLLQLDLVPVAVMREVGGVPGALFIDPAELVDVDALSAANRNEAWCPVDDQLEVMRVFDALIAQGSRTPAQQRFTRGNWKLALTDNHEAFSTVGSVPVATDLVISAFLRAQLSALNETVLAAALGEVLDAERRAALLQRRDILLAAGN